jgi:hypothetical protein
MRRLLLALILIFASGTSVNAEITSPYILDEKPQVLFGDSWEIVSTTTHYGLENYSAEYVNNYLHITFTYSHNQCCFASYPPKLYITALDPQSTTSPIVREQPDVYALAAGSHPTDWYSYDIQFDSTGFSIQVLQQEATSTASFHYGVADFTENDYAALANTSPRQEPVAASSMAFLPMKVKQNVATVVSTTTPVIVVPGISSSYLIKDNNPNLETWMSIPQMLLSVTDSYLDDLDLSSPNVYTANKIIRETGGNDFFSGLFNYLNSQGLVESQDLYEFPYDWRLDVSEVSENLKSKINDIKTSRGVSKVNIVAHSMGGLLVKKYLKNHGGDSVSKFIDIGTPHTGAPKALKILNYGDDFGASFLFGLVGLNSNRIKSISQNMPSVYQLLPSANYFNDSDPEYRYYVFNGVGGLQRLGFNETSNYLKVKGRNSVLVDRAITFHYEVDGLSPADYGVETYNIVGCGTPTIGQFYILNDSLEHPIYNIKMINGDGTVPLRSAEAISASTTYYLKGAIHALMPSTSGVKELVGNLLNSSSTSVNISSNSDISLSSNGCTIPNGKIVSFHSPIELHVYDQSGNHSGPNSNGEIENEISGLVYEIIEDNKFAFLPEGVEYTIKGNALDGGLFDVRIQEIINGQVSTTTVYSNIPLLQNTQAQFTLGGTLPDVISLDNDKDGLFESGAGISTQYGGFLETDGKPELFIVKENTGSVARDSINLKSVNLPPGELVKQISITPTTTTKAPINVSKANPKSANAGILYVPKVPISYENTAIVSKSFNQKVGLVFKKFFNWIKAPFR